MTSKAGSSQACAECKYQRRRCVTNCPLAPYFPADKPKTFQNAHKLFGVSNMIRILKKVRDDQKDEAMKSIIYEADMHERFPVHGCSFVIYRLEEQLKEAQKELYEVMSCLETFRANAYNNNNNKVYFDDIGNLSCSGGSVDVKSRIRVFNDFGDMNVEACETSVAPKSKRTTEFVEPVTPSQKLQIDAACSSLKSVKLGQKVPRS